jgi:tetratricopeptide (TPR) repeat protein
MKSRLRIMLLTTFFATAAFGQDYRSLVTDARVAYQAKDYARSVGKFEEALKLDATSPDAFYAAACSAALAGNTDLALAWLQRAADLGYPNPQSMQSNPDLKSLHDLPPWLSIVAAVRSTRKKIDASIDRPLRAELRVILDEDQKYRLQLEEAQKLSGPESKAVSDLWKLIAEKDDVNLVKVRAILDTRGWLGPDIIGNDGSSTLFLVIQHADLKTQQHYLPMMRAAAQLKKARPDDLALLEDRVALGECRHQIYGSQITFNPRTNKYQILPLADPDHVDERRASVGLPPLAEYVKHWEITWNAQEYKKLLPELEKTFLEKP